MSIAGLLKQKAFFTRAQEYLERGWSVIPLVPGRKVPAIEWKIYQQRQVVEAELRTWFTSLARHHLGIVTGQVSSLMVVDFDDLDLLAKFNDAHPHLTRTCVVKTGRGFHLYYHVEPEQMPAVRHVPGVDLQADGCYVVAPPSVVNGVSYEQVLPHVPLHLNERDLDTLLAFIDALKPRTLDEESTLLPLPCQLMSSDIVAYYRRLLPYGRNEALFKAALRARDDGQNEQWTFNALAEAHIQAVPPRGHRHETYRQRQREAHDTVASAFSRPARKNGHTSPPPAPLPITWRGGEEVVAGDDDLNFGAYPHPAGASLGRPLRREGEKNWAVGKSNKAEYEKCRDENSRGAEEKKQDNDVQLPTAVKQRLNELRHTAAIRLIYALRERGIQPGDLFYYSQAREIAQPLGIGDWSVRKAIHAQTSATPLFERAAPSPRPPLSGQHVVASDPHRIVINPAYDLLSQNQREANHRPPLLYRMPSNAELAQKLGVEHVSSRVVDALQPGDLASAKQTRVACHREFVKQNPAQRGGKAHTTPFLARRVGVSTQTLRRYNAALDVPAVRHYAEFPLNWSNLGRLDTLTEADKGYFLVNAGGKHFPPRKEIAAGQLAAAINVSLFRRLRDTFRYEVLNEGVTPHPPTPSLKNAGISSPSRGEGEKNWEVRARNQAEYEKYRDVNPRGEEEKSGSRATVANDAGLYPARVAITHYEHLHPGNVRISEPMMNEGAASRVSFWLCPQCLKSQLTEARPGVCARCQHDDWELIPESIWRDLERCKAWWGKLWRAHRRKKKLVQSGDDYPAAPSFHEPLPDERAEALAQDIHAGLPNFSLANARQTVATTQADLVREALNVTLQRGNIVNRAGFFVTYIRSEQKFGRWRA